MPIANITLIAGRDSKKKDRLLNEVSAAIERSLGVDPSSIRVYLTEIPREDFLIGGQSQTPSQRED